MRALFGMTLIATLTSCSTTTRDVNADVAQVRAADAAVTRAITAKDVDAISGYYANDAILMPTAEPMIRGKAAIREEWQHILAIPNFTNQTTTQDVKVSGDLAYTYGVYRSKMMGADGNPVEEPGKFVTVWRREPDGKWRIVLDTYNTDIMPPVHANGS
jgi:uncharacterized protein (TIGR02246 family)